ncbi:gfo/Idh/MocA family oxidoreductase [Paenibacillus sp. LMG 31456]|uniref:Gfo/Idh/MocA family oxidoreductase n=1 Tax=Paenibacillus foliorum TaxID=2654974 RepID=A0A972GMX2_9BACL|nr:Gfo/Idh/MocA family oxidoreductase [Paenibacillus foliorum]NOU93731.1 gfo/Idh/MocA family oxidoreductase [Paenibacillus foliorum]
MKAIVVGLGFAGMSMYKNLRKLGIDVAVVESNTHTQSKIEGEETPFYTSLSEALEQEAADFLVNATPPMIHTQVNHAAFDKRLPVFCEKPISFDYAESVEIVQRAERENIPFMIAENYRCLPFVRQMKRMIDDGAIGDISSIDVQFFRHHHVERNYTVHLLDDIGVHHLDMVRYLTGAEGRRIQANFYNPVNGWVEKKAVINAQVFVELDRDIRVTYSGSISSRGPATPWCGNWRLEGTEGMLELRDQEIIHTRDGETVRLSDFSGVHAPSCLNEFLDSLREGRQGETSGRDYLKTQTLIHYAGVSNESGRIENIILPEIL